MTVIDKLKDLGFKTVDESFYRKVREWKSWYVGNVEKFHDYSRYNGKEWVKCRRASLGMGKKVAEDWANLLMNEKVEITLEGTKEQELIDRVFTENNFRVKSNEMQEMAFALGTVAFVPRVVGMQATETGPVSGSAQRIAMDYVSVEHIFPIAWENGMITECAFDSVVNRNGRDYLYLQIHRKDKDAAGREEYVIENHLFPYNNGVLQDEVQLQAVEGFEHIPQLIRTGSDKRQFVIDRPNIANNYDISSPLGISVFANAVDVLVGVDKAYDCYVNEFDNGALIMLVKIPATDYIDGNPTVNSKDNRFYLLPEDTTDGDPVYTVSPQLRTEQLHIGVNDQLNILSSKCGFGENYYRFENGNITTATQVISENSTLFRTIKKHELILESVLVELCRIILRLGNSAMGAGLNEDVEISIDFDDSIIEDKSADFTRDMQLLNAGILNAWEFRAKWLNESPEEAKKALPGMEELTTEPEDEVE